MRILLRPEQIITTRCLAWGSIAGGGNYITIGIVREGNGVAERGRGGGGGGGRVGGIHTKLVRRHRDVRMNVNVNVNVCVCVCVCVREREREREREVSVNVSVCVNVNVYNSCSQRQCLSTVRAISVRM
jgi:hypothetical protein